MQHILQEEFGMSSILVGTLGSVFTLLCLIGSVTGGALFDKIGTLKTMSISLVLSIVAVIGLMIFTTYINKKVKD
ncbi:MFS transporter [Romboutsia sp. 1001216sp1]|nr:MFS transporter [Romboutsia sp. 1001216sp1]MDB8813630.1 MFS transporter [Romboutsia sp. 1001216sp1]